MGDAVGNVGIKNAAGNRIDPATSDNQTAQSALLGAVNETAPATDTASSGHNGRLQRIAQRISSLIALLPASLGQKTKAASFPVVIASDQDVLATSANQTTANTTLSTISSKLTGAANFATSQATAGSASGELVAARATRRSATLRNTDAANSCYVGAGTVTSANGFLLKAGESISIETTAAVNGIRATSDVVVAVAEVFD